MSPGIKISPYCCCCFYSILPAGVGFCRQTRHVRQQRRTRRTASFLSLRCPSQFVWRIPSGTTTTSWSVEILRLSDLIWIMGQIIFTRWGCAAMETEDFNQIQWNCLFYSLWSVTNKHLEDWRNNQLVVSILCIQTAPSKLKHPYKGLFGTCDCDIQADDE